MTAEARKGDAVRAAVEMQGSFYRIPKGAHGEIASRFYDEAGWLYWVEFDLHNFPQTVFDVRPEQIEVIGRL